MLSQQAKVRLSAKAVAGKIRQLIPSVPEVDSAMLRPTNPPTEFNDGPSSAVGEKAKAHERARRFQILWSALTGLAVGGLGVALIARAYVAGIRRDSDRGVAVAVASTPKAQPPPAPSLVTPALGQPRSENVSKDVKDELRGHARPRTEARWPSAVLPKQPEVLRDPAKAAGPHASVADAIDNNGLLPLEDNNDVAGSPPVSSEGGAR
jgi:hypothetical protein